ncbi:MAG TPA: glycosyltransferase family 39 protein [Lacipirellulaceae bacterium]|nr:glycosyltransferase family 39 protein [Lacipirellulaceae bacterium]
MAASVEVSFAAVYRRLEGPGVARRVLAVLLLIQTLLLGYSGYCHSPTLDEPAHLVAGLSYWKFGRFDIYSVNPPLVRLFAALPVMAVGHEVDWNAHAEGPGARPEMKLGEDFVHANGARSLFLITIARWALIPVSWLGAIVCYLWARDLYGRPSGLLACAIWCFEPNVVAHGALITPDVAAAALGLAASYLFWRFLSGPNWGKAVFAGLGLGAAELAKATLVLFFFLWPILWLIVRWRSLRAASRRAWVRESGMMVLQLAAGLYVLNFGYGFEGTLTRLGEFTFVNDSWAGPTAVDHSQQLAPGNRFAGTWLARLPIPLPRNYVLGIDAQLRDFEHYSRPSYLGGEWREHGWWYYYLYACAIKVPLGLWVLGAMALWCRLSRATQFTATWRDEIVLLAPAMAIFALVSSQTGFNEHLRYVLPAFPYFFIAISQVARVMVLARRSAVLSSSLVAALVTWFVASSMWIYPHSLSYFNELIGGPLHGGEYLLGSNLDWGQDLRYALDYRDAAGHPPDVICYGYVEPSETGFRKYSSSEGDERVARHSDTTAVSVDFLFGDPWEMRGNASERAREWVAAYRQGSASKSEIRPLTYGTWLIKLPREE